MNTLAPSFLNQSSSFLQVTRTCMKAWMSSNFGQIPTPTPELSVLARLKNSCRRNLVLTDSLAFAFDFWMLPRYVPEHFGIFPKFNDGRR